MNTIIDVMLKFSGLGKLWEIIDGYKTYIAGGAAILTGLVGVLTAVLGVYNEIVPLLAAHNAAGIIELVKTFGVDPNISALSVAWMKLLGGLAVIGIGHKIDKATSDDSENPNHVSIVDPEKP